jgi:predicted ribosomally synthesized peptide with SipW-like signal peptide
MMRNTKSKLAGTAVVLAAMVALTTVGTLALFTSQSEVGANAFDTGTIVLSTSPQSAVVSYANMMPGDNSTNPLVVSNNGSSGLRYAMSSSATNESPSPKNLKDQLVLTVKTVDATTPVTPCNEFDGSTLYAGDLDSTNGKIIGDVATGQNGVAASGGDRSLANATSETLCFRVELPTATGNSYQGATSTATFTFNAEQTKNN